MKYAQFELIIIDCAESSVTSKGAIQKRYPVGTTCLTAVDVPFQLPRNQHFSCRDVSIMYRVQCDTMRVFEYSTT